MVNSNVDKNVIVTLVICAAILIVGAVSVRYMGNDNAVEEVAEEVVDDVAEKEFHIPLHIDLDEKKKDTESPR